MNVCLNVTNAEDVACWRKTRSRKCYNARINLLSLFL